MTAYAYRIDGTYRVVAEPTCTVLGAESWPSHPWTITDPTVPTYQDCPRCGARRVRIPRALAAAAGRVAGHDRRAGHDPDWQEKHPHADRLAESERRRGRLPAS